MYINAYDLTLETSAGESIAVSLRLPIVGQIKLKKKFNESTITTLFNSIDDPERLAAIFDESLTWNGNKNPIKSGAELLDLMASNGLLGMAEKSRIITKLASASGIISETEREALDARSDEYMKELTGTGTGKNA
jgi:hypothetical protein